MKMLWTILFCTIALTAIAMIVVHFFVPDTRTSTHKVILEGTLADVWSVYTDPASLPDWRAKIVEIDGLSGERGSRSWTEVSVHGVRIDFIETAFDAPIRYELRTRSQGYFMGTYVAGFEQTEPGRVMGTFTETITTEGLRSKLLALVFVRPKALIEEFAREAQAEVNRRSSQ